VGVMREGRDVVCDIHLSIYSTIAIMVMALRTIESGSD
jgi:hypothetical protein